MRKTSRLLLLPGLLALSACGTSDLIGGDPYPRNLREHQERYAFYQVARDELPKLSKAVLKLVPGDRSITLHEWFDLKLSLGARMTTDRPFVHRTSSACEFKFGARRYVAESVFARDEEGADADAIVCVCHDAERGQVFLHESYGWSVDRFILVDSKKEKRVIYYRALSPAITDGPPFYPWELLGIEGGKVYVEQQGVLFGYPLDLLEEVTDLDYTVG
jgi:hypothetical protein